MQILFCRRKKLKKYINQKKRNRNYINHIRIIILSGYLRIRKMK